MSQDAKKPDFGFVAMSRHGFAAFRKTTQSEMDERQ